MEKQIQWKMYWASNEIAKDLGVNVSTILMWASNFNLIVKRSSRRGKREFTKCNYEDLRTIYNLIRVRKFTTRGAIQEFELMKLNKPTDETI